MRSRWRNRCRGKSEYPCRSSRLPNASRKRHRWLRRCGWGDGLLKVKLWPLAPWSFEDLCERSVSGPPSQNMKMRSASRGGFNKCDFLAIQGNCGRCRTAPPASDCVDVVGPHDSRFSFVSVPHRTGVGCKNRSNSVSARCPAIKIVQSHDVRLSGRQFGLSGKTTKSLAQWG